MRNGLLPRTKDKRDYSYFRTFHKDIVANPVLGSAVLASIPKEFDFDARLTMPDQNADGLYNACTAYTSSDIYTNETKKPGNPLELYKKTMEVMGIKPNDPNYLKVPCDIRSALKAAQLYYGFPSYFNILENSPFDAFDSIRFMMFKQGRPASVGNPWPREWEQPQEGVISSIFIIDPNGAWHNYEITGQRDANDVPQLRAKSWQGKNFGAKGFVYLTRDDVNKIFAVKGTFAYTFVPPPTNPGDVVTVAGFWEKLLTAILDFLKSLTPQPVPPIDVPPAIVEEVPLPEPPEVPKYLWDTRANILHSCRVIMDEYALQWAEKATLCSIIEAESNYNTQAKNENKKNGKVWSTDWGLLQINDYYNIGPGKYFASVEEVLTKPEKSVRFLVEAQQRGQLALWSSFKSGTYKQFLNHYL